MWYSAHSICASAVFLAFSQAFTSPCPCPPFWVSECVSVWKAGLFIWCHPAVNQIQLLRLNLVIYHCHDLTKPSLWFVHRSAVKLKDMPKPAHTSAHTLGIDGKDSSGRKTDCECSQASLHQLISVCVFVCVLGEKAKKHSQFTHQAKMSKLWILCPLMWLKSINYPWCQ